MTGEENSFFKTKMQLITNSYGNHIKVERKEEMKKETRIREKEIDNSNSVGGRRGEVFGGQQYLFNSMLLNEGESLEEWRIVRANDRENGSKCEQIDAESGSKWVKYASTFSVDTQ